MRWIPIGAIVVTCAACQTQPDATPLASRAGQPQTLQASCRDFAAPVTTGGKPERAQGQACEQPDGSWRVVQNTPGLPVQSYALAPPAAANAGTSPPATQPSCSSYTAPVTVGGQTRQATIEACPQPDGSWKITQNTPGLPTQAYDVPPPSSSAYPYPYANDYAYPDFFPYWAGSPWFFGLAPSIVVVQHFHHFHHGFGHGFGHGPVHGFGAGFGHGFGAGFGHGFGAGFGHGFGAGHGFAAGGGGRH